MMAKNTFFLNFFLNWVIFSVLIMSVFHVWRRKGRYTFGISDVSQIHSNVQFFLTTYPIQCHRQSAPRVQKAGMLCSSWNGKW